MKMNLPNKLTILRMILVPVFVLILLLSNDSNSTFFRILPLIIFVVASLTDTLDGQIARKYNLVTDFGKFMDPLADKLLVCSALICFIELGTMESWIVIIIIAREFAISGFRMIAASKGVTIAANKWGKLKTITQMVMVIVMLCVFADILTFLEVLVLPLKVLTVILTVVSAGTYIWQNKNVISNC